MAVGGHRVPPIVITFAKRAAAVSDEPNLGGAMTARPVTSKRLFRGWGDDQGGAVDPAASRQATDEPLTSRDIALELLVTRAARQRRSEAPSADDETGRRHPAATAGQRHRALVERAGAVHGLGDRALGYELPTEEQANHADANNHRHQPL
jgi:hypothetical protein